MSILKAGARAPLNFCRRLEPAGPSEIRAPSSSETTGRSFKSFIRFHASGPPGRPTSAAGELRGSWEPKAGATSRRRASKSGESNKLAASQLVAPPSRRLRQPNEVGQSRPDHLSLWSLSLSLLSEPPEWISRLGHLLGGPSN